MQRSAVILLGPPGSGKTTIAEHLTAGNDVAALETGHLLRQVVAQGTEIGKQLRPFLEKGQLAPTDLVAAVVAQALQQLDARVVLFDGFPRREAEISTFFNQIAAAGLGLSGVFVLELSRSQAVERLTHRRKRSDDTPETVNKRIDIYERDTSPVIEYFQTHYPDRTYKESGEKPVDQIADWIVSRLQEAGLDLVSPPGI